MTSENEHANQVAQELVEKYNYEIPVDVYRIASDLELLVTEQDLEDEISGLLVIKDGKGTIGINKNHHSNRQRFTIAHEIGHYKLHSSGNPVFIDATPVFFRNITSSMGSSSQEIAANTFAAELLMPKQKLEAVLNESPIDAFDDSAIRRIAELFGVSTQALTIRLTRLGLITLG